MKSNRKLRNLLLKPSAQLRYTYFLVGITLAPLSILVAYVVVQFMTFRVQLLAQFEASPDILLALQDTMTRVSTASLILLFGVLAAVVFGSIWVSHRFFGPIHVINAFLRDLKEGRADLRRELRKDDEFQETFALLKELAKELQAHDEQNPEKAP